MRRTCAISALAVVLAAGSARAANDEPAPGIIGEGPQAPPGLGWKRPLRDDDLERKREGGYFTGVPIANYDPTTKFGFGGRLYYYWDGHRDDPLFAYTPYLHRVIVQGFGSTAGAQDHLVDYDGPNFLGSLFRLRATFEYAAANAWPYYGVGSRSLDPLAFPGAPGETFGGQGRYNEALQRVQPDGTAYTFYDKYALARPNLQLGIERQLLGGTIRPFLGLGFSYARVRDYTGRDVDATDVAGNSIEAPQAPTRLAADCAAQRIRGCSGGFDNVLRIAISYDTRDFEPDPNSGIFAELSNELSLPALGSDFTYGRILASVRGFYSPIPKLADLVLALRGTYEVQSSTTPFFAQQIMPFIDDPHAGLGGVRTLRGFDQNRFVGPVMVLTNYELRWTFTHVHVLHQDFGLIAVPFLDIGRVFDRVADTSLRGWKRAQGLGFRVAWNEATVLAADFGVSEEGSGLYVNFNHIF